MATSSALKISDIALTWSNVLGVSDWSIVDGDIGVDAGLETAVILSLFVDRRADDDDVPPSGDPSDRRGWWADEFSDVEGDRIGSRLWLLDRSVLNNETSRQADEFVREALAWMITDRVVSTIDVDIEIDTRAKRMTLGVMLHRPGLADISFKFSSKWDNLS